MIQKMKNFLLIFLLSMSQLMHSQVQFFHSDLTKIIYETKYHEELIDSEDPLSLFTDGENVLITSKKKNHQTSEFPFEITFVNTNEKKILQLAFLNEGKVIGQWDEHSLAQQSFKITNEYKEILGLKCQKAKTVINSNTIELWFTKELGIKGSPMVLGQDLGLVLQVIRNGNFSITAVEIQKDKFDFLDELELIDFEELDKLTYQDQVWKSRFTTIPVFENQQIHFFDEFEDREGVERFANGTLVIKKIKFPIINSGHQVFVELKQRSLGDAYDRTGSVFLIPIDQKKSFLDGLKNGISYLPIYENGNGKKYQGIVKTDEYTPLLELMRFFTPFGIGHFNERVQLKGKDWHEQTSYRQEITDYLSMMSGKEVYIGVFVGNYDRGGHEISLDISIHKDRNNDKEMLKVIPLFNTLNVMEMAGQEYSTLFDSEKGLEVEFELKEDLKDAKLRYITTGHGGWSRGDEFVQKKNTIYLNGKLIFDLIPWREDCGSYRLYNPVSGNFTNGLSSSDLSRSNWCPATVTNPYIIELGDLSAGKHSIQIKIPQGATEGNSFSSWNVSGVLIGR